MALRRCAGTIFVYGQTSSGKTHTMQGSANEPGIVPQGISMVFEQIKQRSTRQDFLVRCSYIEIYNENITDLLKPGNGHLKLHTDPKKGTYVGDATEVVLANAQQAAQLIEQGAAARHVGETRMNSESSRSHSIFRMVIESRDKSNGGGAVLVGELFLVDLAGSERQSQTQATGQRLKEGANINKSLLTLSNVISKLSEEDKSLLRIGEVAYKHPCMLMPAKARSTPSLEEMCEFKNVMFAALKVIGLAPERLRLTFKIIEKLWHAEVSLVSFTCLFASYQYLYSTNL